MDRPLEESDATLPRPKSLNIVVALRHGAAIVTPQGNVDYFNMTELKNRIASIIENGCPNVIVDLSRARYIASTTVGILIGQKASAAQRGGDLRLCRLSPGLWKMFGLLGVDSLFELYDTADEAVRSFQ